jgi:hypothetical protein
LRSNKWMKNSHLHCPIDIIQGRFSIASRHQNAVSIPCFVLLGLWIPPACVKLLNMAFGTQYLGQAPLHHPCFIVRALSSGWDYPWSRRYSFPSGFILLFFVLPFRSWKWLKCRHPEGW